MSGVDLGLGVTGLTASEFSKGLGFRILGIEEFTFWVYRLGRSGAQA